MICRLFIFGEETNIDLGVDHSKDKCKYCKDSSECINTKNINQHLTKEAYSWSLYQRLTLPEELQKKAKLVGFQSAISLIHPIHETCWIAQLREKNNEFKYAILQGKSKVGCKSISQLNYSLKKDYKYDGREIEIEDFNEN